MNFVLTQHANEAMRERGILVEWVERAFEHPQLREPDPHDTAIERRYCQIGECANRVLRVAVNASVEPNRVVSVFFDRKMKGKL